MTYFIYLNVWILQVIRLYDYTVKEKESVINALETSSLLLFKCFNMNFKKVNCGKSHLLLGRSVPSTVVIDGCSIESNIKEVLLGITIDRNF